VKSPTIAVKKKDFPGVDQAGFEIYLHSIRDKALKRFAKWKVDNNVLPAPEHIDAKAKRYKRRNKIAGEILWKLEWNYALSLSSQMALQDHLRQ
jgi:hypothetical protein